MASPIAVSGDAGYINVSRGAVDNASRLQKTGFSGAIGSSSQTIWNEASLMVWPTTTAALTVSSGSANDTSAGTGARTVTVTGLDGSFNQITEVISMNGQTAVTTANAYFRVNNLSVTTAGSGGTNAGVIYIGTGVVTAGKPATIYNSIAIGYSTSASAFTTIPVGQTGYLLAITASTDTAGTQLLMLTHTAASTVTTVIRTLQLGVGAGTVQKYELPRAFTAGTDVQLTATNAGTNVRINAQFELLVLTPN